MVGHEPKIATVCCIQCAMKQSICVSCYKKLPEKKDDGKKEDSKDDYKNKLKEHKKDCKEANKAGYIEKAFKCEKCDKNYWDLFKRYCCPTCAEKLGICDCCGERVLSGINKEPKEKGQQDEKDKQNEDKTDKQEICPNDGNCIGKCTGKSRDHRYFCSNECKKCKKGTSKCFEILCKSCSKEHSLCRVCGGKLKDAKKEPQEKDQQDEKYVCPNDGKCSGSHITETDHRWGCLRQCKICKDGFSRLCYEIMCKSCAKDYGVCSVCGLKLKGAKKKPQDEEKSFKEQVKELLKKYKNDELSKEELKKKVAKLEEKEKRKDVAKLLKKYDAEELTFKEFYRELGKIQTKYRHKCDDNCPENCPLEINVPKTPKDEDKKWIKEGVCDPASTRSVNLLQVAEFQQLAKV